MNQYENESARSYLEKILAILDIEAVVNEQPLDETTICYRVDCKPVDAKVLIGRKGQTLEALQFLLRQMSRGARGGERYFLLDVLNYRSRRREQIIDQAKEGAVAVLNGESEEFELYPMTPFERRIVHKYLQESFPELSSNSRGDGADRRIVISYVGLSESEEEGETEEDREYACQLEEEASRGALVPEEELSGAGDDARQTDNLAELEDGTAPD